MPDSLYKALADSSWMYVSPDTYRYFFSASAQVFAAIFAVVAIASSFRLSELNRQTDRLADRKKSIAITFKYKWNTNTIKKFTGIQYDAMFLPKQAQDLNTTTIDHIWRGLLADSNDKINCDNKGELENWSLIRTFAQELSAWEHILEASKRRAIHGTRISVIIAALMTIFSLISLCIETYKSSFIWYAGIIFCIAISTIGLLFISEFKDTPPRAWVTSDGKAFCSGPTGTHHP
ncbi:MAG: hypothetical protein NTW14_02730 [bacterium]|nr:hypothetical protein [bacterium]